MSNSQRLRNVLRILPAINTSDGAGVRLRRSIGSSEDTRLDPFLMLDEFSSDNPGDYIAGFPSHPHRGFETVTYIIDGLMRHEDHLGNQGDLQSGGVQWMTAGRGIIHSEMPQQEEGRMRGFQLWINLPSNEKMKPAGYRDITPDEIPEYESVQGIRIKIIAGEIQFNNQLLRGPIYGLTTEPLYLDISLDPNTAIHLPLAEKLNAMANVFEGQAKITETDLSTHSAAFLSEGDSVEIFSSEEGARFLLLAGLPLNEPIVQYGPFVMNTVTEIKQAIHDYQTGKLTTV